MYTSVLLSSLLATALGAPLAARQAIGEFKPAEGTLATCDASSDKFISLVQGPEQYDVIFDHACKALMPACAYPDSLTNDTVCTMSIDYKLGGPVDATLNALVELKDGHDKLSHWAVNFHVTPAEQPEDSAGVFWTKAQCKGYFQELLMKDGTQGCWVDGLGPSAGTLAVGGTSSLKDTVFGISFVERA